MELFSGSLDVTDVMGNVLGIPHERRITMDLSEGDIMGVCPTGLTQI